MIDIDKRKALIAEITKAFAGVTLEDGIGLKEAQALDDYADKQTQQRYRQEDEKNDWSTIPFERLERCDSSLCFFDAKGMRFHLPAFIIAQLNDRNIDVVGLLTYFWYDDKQIYLNNSFGILSAEQRTAVCNFMSALFTDPDDIYKNDTEIQKAIACFWNKS
jgi:hypothetical protein